MDRVDVRTDGEPATYQARVPLQCTGYYRYDVITKSEFPGVDDYTGNPGPQFWPADLDYIGQEG